MSTEPEVYRMTVHLFGGVWSASCASYALKRTVTDNSSDFDVNVVRTVHRNFYVDDYLKSLETPGQAIRLVEELHTLLKRGRFTPVKWVSNSKEVLQCILVPEVRRGKQVKLLNHVLPVEKALGVYWNTQTDQFEFKISLKDKPNTRRGLLSIISSIFDPFGFVSPVILKAKKIFQDECKSGKGWDDPLEENNRQNWHSWKCELPKLEGVKINRCVSSARLGKVSQNQLDHFADASLQGYGTVSYLRSTDVDGRIHCSFMMAKSRLAPVKQMTVPRLELSAAVLAVRVDKMLPHELEIELAESVFWTESMIVLHYIAKTTRRFKMFVANRIATIHNNSTRDQWRHIDSSTNRADDASRGLDVIDKLPILLLVQAEEVFGLASSLQKAIAGESKNDCGRFQWNRGNLTVAETQFAEIEIVKFVQKQSFGDELKTLLVGGKVKRSSLIYKLDPSLNSDGILCVTGRLGSAPISVSAKHPMILPKRHLIVNMITGHYHQMLGHSGQEHVLGEIRQRFWIIRARVAVRQVLRDCIKCRGLYGKLGGQRMADLPVDRVTAGKPPWTFVGIDCFGPFSVKRGRTMMKRYGCLFTCLTIRAIHIEKLDSMDTDSFINAFIRFQCRRGRPEKLRSDHGTNFTGADREIREAIADWNHDAIEEYLRQRNVQWEYNPPAASHMGGVWERLVRSVRKVLAAVLNEQTLDDEGLSAVFCEAEAIVNSRPMTVVSDNPKDLEPLTLNHLLLLRSEPGLPYGEFGVKDTYKKRWKQIQYMADVFWRRWVREYLPTLQLRQQWQESRRNIQQGDIVLVLNENTPRRNRPLARVLKTFPGKDGLIRSADVKTRYVTLHRPVDKLCLLESVCD